MASIDTLYLIHHSHTDVGYTHDQPIVWDLQERFIDEAIELAEAYAGNTQDSAFRWTIESTSVLLNWLRHASTRQVERLLTLERLGRIEVTGMFANLTPLFDADQLVETFQPLRRLRADYGFDIRHAMNCDVNGQNWPLIDLLLDLGFEGFSMGINTHFGGAPFHRPNAFRWEGPSGRSIPTWNGWSYDIGWRVGIGRDMQAFQQEWWPRVLRHLDQTGYPLPILMMQSYDPFGDNGSAFGGFSTFIEAWNQRGLLPHICMATPRMWWEALKDYADMLPTHRGDWTDYWNFGCISSAREQAINRASRRRLRAADQLVAMAGQGSGPSTTQLTRTFDRYRAPAWENLHLWDEHTWGANVSLLMPESDDTASQWHHKANYAYMARSLSLLLQRDALATLAQQIERTSPDDLLVYNPLPWSRQIAGEIGPGVATLRGRADDPSAGRHFQDRLGHEHLPLVSDPLERDDTERRVILKPINVPGFGYTVMPRSQLTAPALYDSALYSSVGDAPVVETKRYRLEFDLNQGGLRSWYDKYLEHEWIDRQADWGFNRFIHETVDAPDALWPRKQLFAMRWKTEQVEPPTGWNPSWPARRCRPTAVVSHRVYQTPLGIQIIQQLEAPGCVGLLTQSVLLPDYDDYVEFEAWWIMGQNTAPDATYILFPFNIPNATARFDVGSQAVVADEGQLHGVCRDYFTVQNWVNFSNQRLGVTVATPENPMVQIGDFHFGHHQLALKQEQAMLLGWVTNSYWETNFRAHQPGKVSCRYRILPQAGGFDETYAHRFGLEASYSRPLVQHMGEPAAAWAYLPPAGELLRFADSAVQLLHVKPARQGSGIIIRLLNASDEPSRVEIGSALLRIQTAKLCNLLEEPLDTLNLENGSLWLTMAPRGFATVELQVAIQK